MIKLEEEKRRVKTKNLYDARSCQISYLFFFLLFLSQNPCHYQTIINTQSV